MLFAKLNILMFFVALFCFATITHADYIEGIDTTDVNGYGLDSTFQIIAGKVIQATSEATQFIPYFRVDGDGCFFYSFNDLKLAAIPSKGDIIIGNQYLIYYCFIFCNACKQEFICGRKPARKNFLKSVFQNHNNFAALII